MKKSFILYIDSLIILDKMRDAQAGLFIKTIYQYQKTGELPTLDFAMEMALTPFINQFKRDSEMYQKKSEINAINGSKGGKRKAANATIGSKRKRKLANLAYTDTDTDTVKDKEIETRKEKFKSDVTEKHGGSYPQGTLNEFCSYWTEHSLGAKKMRFEEEKFFDVGRRLGTWTKNSFNKPIAKNGTTELPPVKSKIITD